MADMWDLKYQEIMKRLKQIFLTIWQFPQILLGWLVLSFVDMNKVELINGKLMVYSSSMSGGISLGYVIILGIGCYNDGKIIDERHEYGHCRQSEYLGWLYLIVIGIPSLIWCLCYNAEKRGGLKDYYKFYTEAWADKLGGVIRDKEI